MVLKTVNGLLNAVRWIKNWAVNCGALTAIACLAVAAHSAQAASEPGVNDALKVVNYVTWWSLDPEGYHPAILLKLENMSGHDLTGQEIHFQGRFMNLRTMDVTVARKDARGAFLPHQRMLVYLRAPDPFELPISSEQWPKLECKAMCRVGYVGDEGTQILVVTAVDQEAKADDDAREQLEKLPEYTQTPMAKESSGSPSSNADTVDVSSRKAKRSKNKN